MTKTQNIGPLLLARAKVAEKLSSAGPTLSTSVVLRRAGLDWTGLGTERGLSVRVI